MSIGDWIRLALALVAVGVIAFSTAVLVGFSASSNTRITELATQGSGRARTVENLLDRSHHLQSTMIFLDTAAVALASALVTNLVVGQLPSWGVVSVIFAAVVVILVLGRAVPRALALRLPDDVALACARLARVAVILLLARHRNHQRYRRRDHHRTARTRGRHRIWRWRPRKS